MDMSWSRSIVLKIAVALTGGCSVFLHAQGYKIETFKAPIQERNSTYARGINDHGDVVGNYAFNQGAANYNRGFERLADGTFVYPITDPGDLAGCATFATGVNGSGEIVGWFSPDSHATVHGFTLIGGVYTTVDETSDGWTEILGVNNGGGYWGNLDPPASSGRVSSALRARLHR